jgi:hypothetical protein
MPKKSEHHSKLPKTPPKRTGKRGVGPKLDPIEDFETPTRRAPKQGELLQAPAAPPQPRIQDGKCVVHFVKFSFDRDKNRKAIALMDFSLELDEAHAGHFPREVEDSWRYLKKGNVKRIDANGIPPQNVEIATAPDGKADLDLTAATIAKATVSLIVQKGKGKAQKITRLMFRVLADVDKEVAHFCENSYDEPVWIEMQETQARLGE